MAYASVSKTDDLKVVRVRPPPTAHVYYYPLVMIELRLTKNPTLKDFQEYVSQMVVERGFHEESISELFMRFLEESGEMAKAAKKVANMKVSGKTKIQHLDHEIADVFIYLLDICNRFNIDLERSFRDKEKINKGRKWS